MCTHIWQPHSLHPEFSHSQPILQTKDRQTRDQGDRDRDRQKPRRTAGRQQVGRGSRALETP